MKWLLIASFLLMSCSSNAPKNDLEVLFFGIFEKFADAEEQYQTIWYTDGERIKYVLNDVTGFVFDEDFLRVLIYEGKSQAGKRDRKPMRLRASHPVEIKKATLVRELGHRLLASVKPPKGLDRHKILFLVLYEAWEKLYGKDFADKAVAADKKRKNKKYNYAKAWDWALAMTAEQRAKKFKQAVTGS